MLASRAALLLLVVVPAFAAGCGSSSHSTTTTSAPLLTQKQFVAAGNAECIKSDRRIFRLGRLTFVPEGWAKTAAAARQGVAEMSLLRPPANASDSETSRPTGSGESKPRYSAQPVRGWGPSAANVCAGCSG